MKKIDWYSDFVDLRYIPSKTDIVCLFRFEPAERYFCKGSCW